MQLKDLQKQFQESLLQVRSRSTIFPYLQKVGQLSPRDQFLVYVDAYQARLLDQIREDHPGLLSLFGEKIFNRLMTKYINVLPPKHYSLNTLMDQWPKFFLTATIALPFSKKLYLDMFALENTFDQLFYAPVQTVLKMQDCQQLSQTELLSLNLNLIAASRILKISWDVLTTLEKIQAENSKNADEKIEASAHDTPQARKNVGTKFFPVQFVQEKYVVVWRTAGKIYHEIITCPFHQALLHHLQNGLTFAECAEQCQEYFAPETDLSKASVYLAERLKQWLSWQILQK